MSALDNLIEINITQQTQAVQQVSFAIPLIIGPTVPLSGTMNVYTSPAGMLTNGYTTSSPEYIYALELFEQPLAPTEFYVGLRLTAVDQVDTITVNTATDLHVYTGSIAGQPWTFTAGSGTTPTLVAIGIANAINGLTNPTWNAVPLVGVVTITSTVPGIGFTDTSADVKLTVANVTPNYGIADDLAALILISDLWYGCCLVDGTDADVLQLAAAIQPLLKIYIAVSATSAIATNVSTDIGSILKAKSYTRIALIFTPEDTEGKEAAWLTQLVATPGSNNWAFKTLVGCTPDVLTANQIAILIGDPVAQIQGKNVNIYQTLGGVNITQMGTMAGGQFIDITVGIDWFKSTAQSAIYQALVNAPKIPYTNKGTTVLMSALKAVIDQGVVNGLIDGDSPITITAASVLSVPISQRANRVAPTIFGSFRLAGAFNAVIVNVSVSV